LFIDVSGNIGLAFVLTAIAGLSTGIGSAIAYFIRKPRMIYLSFSLGFSAGVMIYVSFVELLPNALENVGEILGIAAFFIGVIFIGIIDMIIPKEQNPHHYKLSLEHVGVRKDNVLMRAGLFTALAIGIHNFPEGAYYFWGCS
jgi:ZIP family zinc transporter